MKDPTPVHRSASQSPDPGAVREALRGWWSWELRPLRFRGTTDPWAVLVSEVMAQQTQVTRVEASWEAFLGAWPTPSAMAAAAPADVLRAWAGLGYNRRALSLHRAACVLVERHGGQVPDDLQALLALPGVGPYTARAVLAIAFGRPVAAVDTNIRRVVTRLLGKEVGSGLQERADALVDAADPAAWTHAMMDVGATICLARRPRCAVCPFRALCASADSIGPAARPTARGRQAGTPPFERTSRWLRGRIIDHLRAVEADRWTPPPGALGHHGPDAVDRALVELEREGLIQRHPDGSVRLPSAP